MCVQATPKNLCLTYVIRLELVCRRVLGTYGFRVRQPGASRRGTGRGMSRSEGELAEGSGLLRPQVEDALAELVALGIVTSDSFAGLRALLAPSSGSQAWCSGA